MIRKIDIDEAYKTYLFRTARLDVPKRRVNNTMQHLLNYLLCCKGAVLDYSYINDELSLNVSSSMMNRCYLFD